MSAHLRRVHLAPSVVDSRNKKYIEAKRRAQLRSIRRSKSNEKIIPRGNIIDEIAYDTQHHPIVSFSFFFQVPK